MPNSFDAANLSNGAADPNCPVVMVLDDDPGLCDSLRYLIESVGLRVQTYLAYSEFLAAYDPNRPGCIILDVRMPGHSGLEVQELLKARNSIHPVIIVTGHGDVAMAIRAMKAGAFDFVEKPFSNQALLDRVQHAVEADARLRRDRSRVEKLRARFSEITAREMQVFERVVAGQCNKAIAEALNVSRKTIEVHRSHIMAKTRAKSLAQLVQMVCAAGLMEPDFDSWTLDEPVAKRRGTEFHKPEAPAKAVASENSRQHR